MYYTSLRCVTNKNFFKKIPPVRLDAHSSIQPTPTFAKLALARFCVCIRSRILLIWKWVANPIARLHCNSLHADKPLDCNRTGGKNLQQRFLPAAFLLMQRQFPFLQFPLHMPVCCSFFTPILRRVPTLTVLLLCPGLLHLFHKPFKACDIFHSADVI